MSESRQLFRPKYSAAVLTSIWTIMAIVGFFQIVTPSAKWGVRLAGCVLLPAGAWLARCGYRLGLVMNDATLDVRGFWRTRTVALSEISRAYVGSGTNVVQPTKTLHLVFNSGEDRRYQEISTSALSRRPSKIEAVADSINAVIQGQ